MSSRAVALLGAAVAAVTAFDAPGAHLVEQGGACGRCTAAQCAAQRCSVAEHPFVCTKGEAVGGCSKQAWSTLACTACCDATSCGAAARHRATTPDRRLQKHVRSAMRHGEANGSSCFDTSVSVGPPIAAQPSAGTYGSVVVVNGAASDMWIQWLASEADDGPFATAWTAALSDGHLPNWWWMNDASHSMGIFRLPKGQHALLPYFGTSVRVAPSPGCVASSAPRGKVAPDAGRAIVGTCTSSRGGAPSPQSLVEWTFTPSPYDVIDSSFVDGYSLPMRLEYLQAAGGYRTILGRATQAGCAAGGGTPVKDASGAYAGCQSPCSATNDPAACCAGAFSTPDTCHPNGVPASPAVPPWCDAITKVFAEDGKRVGYCYAYDDEAGSITDHERGLADKSAPRVKVTFCDYA